MAPRKSLYQLLGVAADASPESVRAAFDVQFARLASSASPEAQSDRAILTGAIEVLGDPARRRQYDEWLLAERRRALTSGSSEDERPRPANARPAVTDTGTGPAFGMHSVMFGVAALLLAGGVGAWVYFDHAHKVAAQRLEAERVALESKRLQEEAEARATQAELQKARAAESDREAAEQRRWRTDNERTGARLSAEQQRAAVLAQSEERNRQQAVQRAEQQRRVEEQESLRRSQQQLQNEKRYLQELEKNRTMKF